MTVPPYNDPSQGPQQGGQPGWGQPAGWNPQMPYGFDPVTGVPYSEKSKVIAAILQILLPFGVGRFYTGHTGMGVAQLLVVLLTCGAGTLWPIIDGVLMLVGKPTDSDGRLLRS